MQSIDLSVAGILPCQSIETLIATGAIASDTPFDADQVQPASLDLRLSDQAWRVRASFLPGQRKVLDRIADVSMHRHRPVGRLCAGEGLRLHRPAAGAAEPAARA